MNYNKYVKVRPRSELLFQRAEKVLSGGVTHSGRFWDPHPIYIDRGQGSHVFDIDGNEYIDYFCANGSMIVGYNNINVMRAVKKQLERGSHFGMSNELMVKLAEKLVKMIPSAELLRFTNSGTESNMHSVRVARGYTKRDKIAKIAGGFNGITDELYWGYKPPWNQADCAGIPESAGQNLVFLPFNDIDKCKKIITENKDELACILMEPITHFVIPPEPNFLESIREITEKYGIVLIFDEVVTNFRIVPGGAQEYFNVIPDLTCIGKAGGGMFPFGALVGKKEIMEIVDPNNTSDNRVDIYGTHSGNPVTMVASLATLELLEDGKLCNYVNSLGDKLVEGMENIIDKLNMNVIMTQVGAMFNSHFDLEKRPISPTEAALGNKDKIFKFHFNLLDDGVFFSPGTSFGRISTAHSNDDIELTLIKMEKAMRNL